MDMKSLGFSPVNHALFAEANTSYKVFAELLDETTHRQFHDVLSQPYVTYAALMPDAHAGYSMPIGGVCAAKDTVVPQFVGFDIGCGMCAYQTDYSKEDVLKHASEIYAGIVRRIPLGFKKHKNHQPFSSTLSITPFAEHVLNTSGRQQLGTLGGGNHFIEVGYGKDGRVWIVIHSGSRGFGHKVASHYMYQAYLKHHGHNRDLDVLLENFTERNRNFREHNPEGFGKALEKFKQKQTLELNKRVKLDALPGIWGLEAKSTLGEEYITDQRFALAFALENRKRMITVIHGIMNETIGGDSDVVYDDETRFINRNHNHVEYDEARGEWIHRKGATHAEAGMHGVIPGNMRDGSFIVVGKGHTESLCSSSHGAGRVMSRSQAKKNVSMDAFRNTMQGITGTVDENTLDESPFAYKDIFEVMALQSDLVEVVEHVKVLINVKDNSKTHF